MRSPLLLILPRITFPPIPILPMVRLCHLIAVFALLFGSISKAEQPQPAITPAQEKFFETRIRPVLAESCFECHGPKKQQAGLRLDHRTFMIAGGESGSVLTPGQADESRLWAVLQHDPLDTQMPPKAKLPDDRLADLRRWIEMGAPWPAEDRPELIGNLHATDWKNHWSFQPIARPQPPATQNQDWPESAIDRFVLERLEAESIAPSGEADRATLIRRVKYDLLGLPPTHEETQTFVNDPSPEAYARLVEGYLNSPHLGERWARYWMDVARYADTKGYVFQEDRNYPDAWKYRDWLIKAFYNDMPFDRFIVLQLAADQASEDPNDLHAMGYLTLGRRFLNNPHDIIDDRIDVVSRGLMGLTVTCARCHDHKYDPIPTADYYSLYGVFASCEEPKNDPSPLRMVDKEKVVQPVVFRRGSPSDRGKQVPRQFLQVVAGEDRKPFEKGSGRLEMSQAIASADNPLTARVWANRVWGHLIGNPLVRTPSDFGVRSDPPTHPELLDWLAGSLIDSGWSTKELIREIVLSKTYRQRSQSRPEIMERDPDNELLSHMNRRRTDFETLRDSMLAVSGRLDTTLGGQPQDITSQPFPTRRTVYAFIDRQNLPGVFRTFDFAGPDTHAPERYETNVPQQALFLMNSPFVMQQAQHLTDNLPETDRETRIRELYKRVLQRAPLENELQIASQFLDTSPHPVHESTENRWQYGYGELDPEQGVLKSFTRFPHFTGSAWQGGDKLPDEKLGWATLNKDGGHVGNDLQHAVVRRWIVPHDGRFSLRGTLKHQTAEGDGVRGRILLSGVLQMDVWEAHNSETETRVPEFEVKAGQSIDFVTDLKGSVSHDSFNWPVRISLVSADGGERLRISSEKEFAGPAPQPLDPWSQLAQVLLLSNEFQFID